MLPGSGFLPMTAAEGEDERGWKRVENLAKRASDVTAVLRAEALQKTYTKGEREVVACENISFSVNRGEFVCIVGPSGCGKTTLLKCICHLLKPTAGKVLINAAEVNRPPKEMILIFQDYSRSLFPWRTVLKNVLFVLEKKDLPRKEKMHIATSALASVHLEGFENHYPWELSGGMQQRVAIARGIAYNPDILLMDEPFASVDAQTRSDLEDTILEIWSRFSQTILLVTHDIEEAIYLADRVLVLSRRPAAIREEIQIGLERPRNQLTTKEDKRFIQHRHHIYTLIKEESQKPCGIEGA
jgi:NitT/TauT family transport system ATP-binding protein